VQRTSVSLIMLALSRTQRTVRFRLLYSYHLFHSIFYLHSRSVSLLVSSRLSRRGYESDGWMNQENRLSALSRRMKDVRFVKCTTPQHPRIRWSYECAATAIRWYHLTMITSRMYIARRERWRKLRGLSWNWLASETSHSASRPFARVDWKFRRDDAGWLD